MFVICPFEKLFLHFNQIINPRFGYENLDLFGYCAAAQLNARRHGFDRLPKSFQFGMGVAVVDGLRGMAGEPLAEFLGNTSVGHGGIEGVAEGVESEG